MDQKIKIIKALRTLKSNAEYVITGSVVTEEDFFGVGVIVIIAFGSLIAVLSYAA